MQISYEMWWETNLARIYMKKNKYEKKAISVKKDNTSYTKTILKLNAS